MSALFNIFIIKKFIFRSLFYYYECCYFVQYLFNFLYIFISLFNLVLSLILVNTFFVFVIIEIFSYSLGFNLDLKKIISYESRKEVISLGSFFQLKEKYGLKTISTPTYPIKSACRRTNFSFFVLKGSVVACFFVIFLVQKRG